MSSLPAIIAGLIYIMIFTQMALDEESSRRKAEKLYEELEIANIRLMKYADEIEELATIQERNRLAREIHDGLGHYLTTVLIQLQAAEALLPSDHQKAKEAIEKARSQSKLALIDVRQSVSAFRYDTHHPEDIDDMIVKALKPCEWVGIQSNYIVLGERAEISGLIQSTIFRIAQETVNNACKYSRASNYSFTIDYQHSDKLLITIVDDGVGSNQLEGGYGILGLRERVELLNGSLKISSKEGEGVTMEIELPYE
jgi:signal transduction histidine kinase